MAVQLRPEEKDIYQIVRAIIQLVEGRHNSCGEVTLTPGATTTVVDATNCSDDAEVQITAKSANAAAALATTWVSATERGSFTLTHANNAQTDRVFGWTATGG